MPAWDERRPCPGEEEAEGLEGPHVVGGPGEDEADGLDTGPGLGQLKEDTHREVSGRIWVPSALDEF